MTTHSRAFTQASSLFAVVLAFLTLLLSGCGGGGSAPAPASNPPSAASSPGTPTTSTEAPGAAGTPATANVAQITVDGGTDGLAINEPFVTVTLCQPGTSTCQTIDHVLLDTGSSGLRVLASALQAVSLPAVTAPGGAALAECASFASGYSWGSVRRADVKIGGETAAAIPVEVVNDTSAPYATVPAACRNQGSNMGAGASAKGILGIGLAAQDCGAACASNALAGYYYACTGANQCTASTAPLSSQVPNPVVAFPVDNNGVAIAFPAVSPPGSAGLAGSVTFGIGTQAGNPPGAASVYATNNVGEIQTTYKGAQMSSFLDSGSNGYFFTDTAIKTCSSGFYCPSGTLQLQAQLTGTNGTTATIDFALESFTSVTAATTAAPIGGTGIAARSFDWGLPFFFGRTVYVAIAGAQTPIGTGPYWAF